LANCVNTDVTTIEVTVIEMSTKYRKVLILQNQTLVMGRNDGTALPHAD
jgi:hypothetical protein